MSLSPEKILFYYRVLFGLIFLNVFLVTNSYSQTPVIDSLKRELNNTSQSKISTLFGLCSHGESMPADSLAKFATMAKQISVENKNLHDQFLSDFYIAESYSYKGMADSALEICNKDLKLINGNVTAMSVSAVSENPTCF